MKKRNFLLIILISIIAITLFAFPASAYAGVDRTELVYNYANMHPSFSIISSPFNEPLTIQIVYSNYADALSAAKNMANAAMYRTDVQDKIATLNNEEFINYLYDALFHRTPDAEGYSNWLSNLNNGITRSEAINSFIDSAEFGLRYIYDGTYGEDVFKVVVDRRI
jgi:hypothetical protein